MLRTERDALLCVLWAITYTLVLIGTKKYKYPLISPVTPIFIASLEFSVLYQLLLNGQIVWNHVWFSYLFWVLVEIAIVVQQIRHGYIQKKNIWIYLVLLSITTIIMCYLVAHRGYRLFFTHFNTFVGEIFWLIHVKKKEYPIRPIVLVLFILKFAADVIGVSVYFRRGLWPTNLICILLPILDFMFIHIYLQRKEANSRIQY